MPSKTSTVYPHRRTCDCHTDMLLSGTGIHSVVARPERPLLLPVSAFHCAVMLLGSRAEVELKEIVLFVAKMSSSLVVYTTPAWSQVCHANVHGVSVLASCSSLPLALGAWALPCCAGSIPGLIRHQLMWERTSGGRALVPVQSRATRLPRASSFGSGNVQGEMPPPLLASALLLQVLKMIFFIFFSPPCPLQETCLVLVHVVSFSVKCLALSS